MRVRVGRLWRGRCAMALGCAIALPTITEILVRCVGEKGQVLN